MIPPFGKRSKNQEVYEFAEDQQRISVLAAAAFGFGTFETMQKAFLPRHRALQQQLTALGDSTEKRWELWETYKLNYYRLTEGGAPKRG